MTYTIQVPFTMHPVINCRETGQRLGDCRCEVCRPDIWRIPNTAAAAPPVHVWTNPNTAGAATSLYWPTNLYPSAAAQS